MAFRPVCRQGDKTSHGGTILEGYPKISIDGIPAAGVGHKGFCPQCKTEFVIVAGAANVMWMGKNVAVEGMLTSCGAALIASQKATKIDVVLGTSPVVEAAKAAIAATAAVKAAKALMPYDEQTKLVSVLIEGVPYFIETNDGQTLSGRIGPDGKLPRIDAKDESEYTVLWGDEALEKMGDK